MTVQSQGPYWQRRLADRYHVQMFRRVTTVYLYGPEKKRDLLPVLARFDGLRELHLYNTAIGDSDLKAWMLEHPRVAVTSTHSVATR